MKENRKNMRKKAGEFISLSFEALNAEPKMLKVLDLCDGMKESDGTIPEDMDFSEGIRKSLAENTARRKMLDIVLSGLDSDELKVINGFYRDNLPAEDIVEIVRVERSEVYRIKDRALEKVGRLMGK